MIGYLRSNVTKLLSTNFFEAVTKYGPSPKAIQTGILAEYGVTLSQNGITSRITRARQTGNLPLESGNTVQDGLSLFGTSTLYGSDGKIKIQWVKTNAKRDSELHHFQQAIEDFINSARIRSVIPITNPTLTHSDTMSIYSIGDAHIGLLAWGAEVGEDYDSDIGTADLLSAIDLLVEQAYPSEEAFIIDTGDWYHSNGQQNTTTAGTRVDVDSRFAKMIQVGLNLAVSLVEKALTKHKLVRWRSAIGNHDTYSSLYVTCFLQAWFKDEPRVIVHDSPSVFMYHQFGKNLIGITHGHTVKPEKLGEIMSVDCKPQWSVTDHRYWYTGHVHHQQVKEFSNCVVETFNTLTGKDAWHAASGYRSNQSMRHTSIGTILLNQQSSTLLVYLHKRQIMHNSNTKSITLSEDQLCELLGSLAEFMENNDDNDEWSFEVEEDESPSETNYTEPGDADYVKSEHIISLVEDVTINTLSNPSTISKDSAHTLLMLAEIRKIYLSTNAK